MKRLGAALVGVVVLVGMKFYQLRWDFDWWAKNRDAPQRTVLFEVAS